MDAVKPIRFGLIGPGEVADNWLVPALAHVPGAQFWSVAARDAARAAAFARKHGALAPVPAHDSLEAMLADPLLDAVIIATPDTLHASQAIAAARAGKHVFVEKPMATTVADARAMTDAARSANVTLGVAYQNRWHAGHRALRRRVMDGQLGTLRHLRVEWCLPAADASNWRTGPAGRWWSMAALGAHCLDLARWLMEPTCGGVDAVRALFSDAAFGSGRDETALVNLRFASGATASLTASVALPASRVLTLHGSKDSARCEWTLGARGAGSIAIGSAPIPFVPVNPYVGELTDFADAIREDRDPEVSGEEGALNVAFLCMAEESSRGVTKRHGRV